VSDGKIIERPHDHDWVRRRLAVGSGVYSADDLRSLLNVGITHVLDCRGRPGDSYGEKTYRGTGIVYLHNPTDDDGEAKPPEWFWRGISFVREAMKSPEAKVLVHCAAGINRAPSMVYAILRSTGVPAARAERAIRQARPRVSLRYMRDADRAVSG
jgi:hypothetical protein